MESDNISAIRAIDFKLEEFEYNKTLQLEMQTCSIKFGQFAREALKLAMSEGRVPIIEFDERIHQYGDGLTKVHIHSMNLGRRGLLNLIQDQREVLI